MAVTSKKAAAPVPIGSGQAFLKLAKAPDVQFALALMGIILVMIVPLPAMLLDLLLALSITISILILFVAIYVEEPLKFSTFPSILLISTLFRLALNVATTRSILLDGATGKVSEVVSAFGQFVVGGNYFVGFVIFAILVVINFIVITKGAGRIAEVGARFTLDAMPGKQMSIDADLNAGIIDREEARLRRTKIESEADFYGAMDGASKFVRGDAIAGIIIAGINIVVGLIVGVLYYNMEFTQAAQVFTLLTVGDGLVSQIPALIISTAAGIVVTRAGNRSTLGDSLNEQMLGHSQAIYLCAALLFVFSLIPGLPTLPFLGIALGFIALGRYASQTEKKRVTAAEAAIEEKAQDPRKDSIESLLHIDVLSLEVGVGLISLVDATQDGEVLERIVSARKQFAQEMGIVVPMVMVKDNIQLRPGEYQILLKGNVIGRGNLMADYFLAMDPGDISDPIQGIETKEPAYGLDALWVKPSQKDEATFKGYTVVNCATVMVTHLTKLIEENCSHLIGRQEVQHLADQLKEEFPKVVEDVLGSERMSLGEVVKILQNLLNEKVGVRDLLTIFETIGDHCKTLKNPDALTRYVRRSLGRGIATKLISPDGFLHVLTLDRALEDLLVSALQQREDGGTSLQIEPEMAQRILNATASRMDAFGEYGSQPIILCGSLIRWDLKQLISRFIPAFSVVAFDEIPADIKTKSVGTISI